MDDLQSATESLHEPATEPGPAAQADETLWLALDQGGHASRAMVFDRSGRPVTQAFAPIGTRRLDADRVEHDPLEMVQSLRTVIDDVAHSLRGNVDRLQAAGLATQRSSIVCWHAQSGEPLSPVLSWQDRRNAALIERLRGHQQAIQQITGLVLSPHYGASKLRWCLDELPAVQQAQQGGQLRCGPLASYLLRSLLEERPHVVDPANASRTQLWSPDNNDWHDDLLQWFGVPRTALPRPVTTLHSYGHLQVGKHRVPLLACTGDQAAVPFANGALDDDCIYVNLGTGAFALAPLQRDLADAAPLLRSVLYSEIGRTVFALEGTVNGAAAALHWLTEHSALDVQRATAALQRQQAARLSVPLFINGIGGVGSPYWLPQLESRFVPMDGVDVADQQAQLVAVMESIAFLLTANIELMRRRLPNLARIVVGGGLSSSRYICECIADLNNVSVMRLAERELTARGLAYLVAGRPAHWPRARTARFTPHPNAALLARQTAWRQLMAEMIR